MTRYLTLDEVIAIHAAVIAASGGADGIRDVRAIESSLAQPQATFAGQELLPSIHEKAAALALSLVLNHPFVDGNKRVGLIAVDVFLQLNGYQLVATDDDLETIFLDVAAGKHTRQSLSEWLGCCVRTL